jgi:cbb3-type cytochrome oxidase maturation protein
MSVIYIVFPVALLVAAAAAVAFIWAVRSGQMDDLDTPPLRMLHDDDDNASSGGVRKPPRVAPDDEADADD